MTLSNTQMSSPIYRKSYFSAILSDETSNLDKQGIFTHVFKDEECDGITAKVKLMIMSL